MKNLWLMAGMMAAAVNVYACQDIKPDKLNSVGLSPNYIEPGTNEPRGTLVLNFPAVAYELTSDAFAEKLRFQPGECFNVEGLEFADGTSLFEQAVTITNRSGKPTTIETANTVLPAPLVLPSDGMLNAKFDSGRQRWVLSKIIMKNDPLPPGAIPSGAVGVPGVIPKIDP